MWRCLLPLLLLSIQPLCAQNGFSLKSHGIEIPERGIVPGYRITAETNAFTLLPPSEASVNGDESARTVTIVLPGGSCWLELRFLTNYSGKLPSLDVLKNLATDRVGATNVTATGACHAGLGSGTYFDLEKPATATGEIPAFRVGFLPYSSGLVQLTFFSFKRQLSANLPHWGSVLNSLQSASASVD